MKTKIFTMLFAIVAGIGTMFAAEVKIGNLYYRLNDSNQTAEVADGGHYSGSIIIPSSVTYNYVAYSVIRIGSYAFMECTGLTSIEIPNSVTSIGHYAFKNCTGLTSIEISNSVTNIECYAFEDCTGLTSIEIPNGVTSIEGSTFRNCKGLTSIEIPNSVTSIGGAAFAGCTGLTSIMIPNSVTSIGDAAFIDCTGLTSITIPNNVTSIGQSAFEYCTGLTHVTIGNSVIEIGGWAFYGCTGLTSVTIGNSVTSIGESAFYGCTGLTSVTIGYSVTIIENNAFDECTSLKTIYFNGTMAQWCSQDYSELMKDWAGGDLYIDGKLLTSANIPSGITEIGSYAFYKCTCLTSVTIPNGVKTIGSWVFKKCANISSITCYSKRVPAVTEYTFDGIDKSTCILYVLADYLNNYVQDYYWGDFEDIRPIGAKSITVTTTKAEPSTNSVDLSWASVSGAATYDVILYDNNGNVKCKFTFDAATGRLLNFSMAPSRNDETSGHVVAAAVQASGLSFTITSLDEGTTYTYKIDAKNSNESVIDTKTGSFTTLSPEGIDDVMVNNKWEKGQKVLRSGHLLIIHDGKIYTLQGQEVK